MIAVRRTVPDLRPTCSMTTNHGRRAAMIRMNRFVKRTFSRASQWGSATWPMVGGWRSIGPMSEGAC